MNKNILFLFALAVSILTMGAGCAWFSTTTPATQPVTVPTASTPDSSLAPMPSSDGTRALVATETNETWKLYTNKALGYSINTPTKGKYAPDWEMKYFDQTVSQIITTCYFPNNVGQNSAGYEPVHDNVVTPDGTKFCHTRSEISDLGSNFVVDDYATVLGKKFIVMEFTKLIFDASVVGCTGKMTEAYSLSKTACIPFVASDYQTTLDGIVGTFQMNSASTGILPYNGTPGPSDPVSSDVAK